MTDPTPAAPQGLLDQFFALAKANGIKSIHDIPELIPALMATEPAAPQGEDRAAFEPTEAMIAAYLKANDAYWKQADELPSKPGKWRNGTPTEATRVSLQAALTAERAKPNPNRDAYEGAREDLLDWKRRALEAEESNRQLVRALGEEVNGPTFMGDPVLPERAKSAAVLADAEHHFAPEFEVWQDGLMCAMKTMLIAVLLALLSACGGGESSSVDVKEQSAAAILQAQEPASGPQKGIMPVHCIERPELCQ